MHPRAVEGMRPLLCKELLKLPAKHQQGDVAHSNGRRTACSATPPPLLHQLLPASTKSPCNLLGSEGVGFGLLTDGAFKASRQKVGVLHSKISFRLVQTWSGPFMKTFQGINFQQLLYPRMIY